MIRSFSVASLIILIFALFESAILSNLVMVPAIPDFLLLMVVYLSVQNGRLYGTSIGFVSGLFIDFLSLCPFGLHSLLNTIIGYVAGFFHKTLNINGIILPMLLGAIATLVKALVLFVISLFYPAIKAYSLFSIPFLGELILNSLFTPLVFSFLGFFSQILLLDMERNR